jgi:hypothetical protein
MIKPGALVMGVVMAAVSAGTYYGLELLPPGVIPPPIGRVVAEQKPAEPTPAPPPVASAAPMEPAPAPATEAEPTEQDLAEEPPPPAAEPAADKPDPAPAAAAEPEPAPAPAAAPPPKAAEAPKPAAKPAPAPAPEQEPEQKPETVASAPPASSAPAKKSPESDVIKPWWPTDTSKMPATQLKLQYAGQVQGQGAIALLFSAPLKIDTVKSHAAVRNAKGETVGGEWALGKNPKLAVFKGLAPGRYTVILQPQIADQQGYMLGQTLKGPVYIKE